MSTSCVEDKSLNLTPSNLSTSRASLHVYTLPSPQEQAPTPIKSLASHKRMSMKQFPIRKYRIIKPLSYTPKHSPSLHHLPQVPSNSSLCTLHNKQKQYICLTCKIRICPSCSISESKHLHHQLRRYQTELNNYNSQIQQILTKIKQTKQKLLYERRSIEQQLKVRRYQEERRLEHVDNIRAVMIRTCEHKMEGVNESFEKVKQQQQSLVCLERLYAESITMVKKLPRSELIKHSQIIEQKLIKSEVHFLPLSIFIPSVKEESYVHPPFEQKYMIVDEYERTRENKNQPIIDYISNGSNKWKIKVYSSGYICSTSSPKMKEREYLSIYLEMVEEAVPVPIEYNVKIVLVHQNGVNHLERSFKCVFQKGESWGYDRVTRVQNLYARGLISKNGSLLIKFSIANNNFKYPLEQINSVIENKQAQITLNRQILNSFPEIPEISESLSKQTEVTLDSSSKISQFLASNYEAPQQQKLRSTA